MYLYEIQKYFISIVIQQLIFSLFSQPEIFLWYYYLYTFLEIISFYVHITYPIYVRCQLISSNGKKLYRSGNATLENNV